VLAMRFWHLLCLTGNSPRSNRRAAVLYHDKVGFQFLDTQGGGKRCQQSSARHQLFFGVPSVTAIGVSTIYFYKRALAEAT